MYTHTMVHSKACTGCVVSTYTCTHNAVSYAHMGAGVEDTAGMSTITRLILDGHQGALICLAVLYHLEGPVECWMSPWPG